MEITRTLATESLTQERIAEFARKQAMQAGREALQNVPSLQEATGMWLKQYKKGRFEVTVDTSKLEPHMEALRGITQTLVVGLLTVGILISSAIAGSVPESTGVKGMHTVADIGYAASLVLAVVLVVTLLARARPGRKR